ncbi:MAG: pyrimidine 5'-nucleotidase [Pseudomonadota bacterium]
MSPPIRPPVHGVETWVFDLDNTLYPPEQGVFEEINARMTRFIMDALDAPRAEADALRRRYWGRYGATLKGLMVEHGVSAERFLDYVHDVDLSPLRPAPGLAALIAALPGRKIVHTNGSRAHADRVLARLGVAGAFEARYGIEDSGFTPKPARVAFERVMAAAAAAPERALMIEDDARNLEAPRALGMRTVWIRAETRPAGPAGEAAPDAPPPWVEHTAPALEGFLRAALAALTPSDDRPAPGSPGAD